MAILSLMYVTVTEKNLHHRLFLVQAHCLESIQQPVANQERTWFQWRNHIARRRLHTNTIALTFVPTLSILTPKTAKMAAKGINWVL